ncbi:MFS general substrate transporter [Fomitiporia mediterranea MF3/22]|uniref:MFS general substrate transporter n=1 Tax=Fomitiporia mediterranea (strain MF3/22) TaxID=694068 RepID=UPI0004407819|nr:MFS general substrate transporter [Fomitiporia mediterranea MF3/22]EJD08431.1 MFS general substrate transporter [Fomitiporia mediterranea MF3/22]
MAFGILEDKTVGLQVPGTVVLSEEEVLDTDINRPVDNIHLKRSTCDKDIILNPQPSDDPKDPLNWPRWKKECQFWSLCLAAGLAGSVPHLLNAGFKDIATEWGVPVNAVAETSADLSLASGIFTLVQGSLAIKFGRRPVFLFASACQFFTCTSLSSVFIMVLCMNLLDFFNICGSIGVWAATSTNITSLKLARVFQGFGMAPYFALAAASIGDIFFVHERGKRVAIWNFAIGGGVTITPIVDGPVISTLGWRWTFWIILVMFGISLLSTIFLMPETMVKIFTYQYAKSLLIIFLFKQYDCRSACCGDCTDDTTNIVEVEKTSHSRKGDIANEVVHVEETDTMPSMDISVQETGQRIPRAKTFLEELKPWSYSSDITFTKSLLRPLPFALSPAVWFAFFAYGCTALWLVVISVIYSLVFGSAPYFFDSKIVGLISIGPFIRSIIGTAAAGPLSDWSVKWAARRNKGVYEPEFRLFLLFPMFVLDVAGCVGWAIMQPKGLPWIGPVVMYSMISSGQCIGATAICSYLIDVHRTNSPECFALVNFAKGMLLYAVTLFVNGWVVDLGVLRIPIDVHLREKITKFRRKAPQAVLDNELKAFVSIRSRSRRISVQRMDESILISYQFWTDLILE